MSTNIDEVVLRLQSRLDDQQAKLDDQEAELTRLRGCLEELQGSFEHEIPAPGQLLCEAKPALPRDAGPANEVAPTGRREVLKHAGALAAGALAGGAALAMAQASPAAATDGAAINAGQSNTSTQPTLLRNSGLPGSENILTVLDFAPTVSSAFAAAVGGYAYGNSVFYGMYGYSQAPEGAGLVGWGTNQAIDLYLYPSGSAPPTRSVLYSRGSVHCDSSGDLWLCTASGFPGNWQKLGGPATAGQLHILATTTRVYDSRPGQSPVAVGPKTPMQNGDERAIDTTFGGTGTGGASAVLVNLAVTNTNSGGFLGAFKNGTTWPNNASINWGLPNISASNLVVVAVDAAGLFTLHCGGSTDLVVDVIGYYR